MRQQESHNNFCFLFVFGRPGLISGGLQKGVAQNNRDPEAPNVSRYPGIFILRVKRLQLMLLYAKTKLELTRITGPSTDK